MVINKKSSIQDCLTPVSFNCIDAENATTKLSAIHSVVQGQLINIKATVCKTGAGRIIKTMNRSSLKKQEAIIVGPFSSIKLILWEDHVDSIVCGEMYLFKGLKKDRYNDEIYANTAMSGSEIIPSTRFDQPLAEQSDTLELSITSSKEVTADILGVASANSHYTCGECNRVAEKQGNFVKRNSCNLMQKLSSANKRVVCKVVCSRY